MRITAGLAVIVMTLSITACSPGTAGSSAPPSRATTCQAQVAAWSSGAEHTVNQIFSEILKLTGAMATASSAVQLAPYAGPLWNLARRANAELPPRCAPGVSRDWSTLIARVSSLSAHLRLADTAGIDSYARLTVAAIARMTIGLHMHLNP